LPVVIRTDFRSYSTFDIAVEALRYFSEDRLLDAFRHCIHDGFQPQEFLTGIHLTGPHPTIKKTKNVSITYNHLYQTLDVTCNTIAQYSMGPTFPIPNVTHKSDGVMTAISSCSLDPDAKSRDNHNVKRSKSIIDISVDLDDWGHDQHCRRNGIIGSAAEQSKKSVVYHSIRSTACGPFRTKVYPTALQLEADDEYRAVQASRTFTRKQ
jgi:hypothetical protein